MNTQEFEKVKNKWWWRGKDTDDLSPVALWWELIRRNKDWRAFQQAESESIGYTGPNEFLENLALGFDPSMTWPELQRLHSQKTQKLLKLEREGLVVFLGKCPSRTMKLRSWYPFPPLGDALIKCKNENQKALEKRCLAKTLHERLQETPTPKLIKWIEETIYQKFEGKIAILIDRNCAPDTAGRQVVELMKRLRRGAKGTATGKRASRQQEWTWLEALDCRATGFSLKEICDAKITEASSTASKSIKNAKRLIAEVFHLSSSN